MGDVPTLGAISPADEDLRSAEYSSLIEQPLGQKQQRILTSTIQEGNSPSRTVKSIHERFEFSENVWDEELVQRILDPDGLNHATTYAYYDDWSSDTKAQLEARLKSVSYPDESWVAYDYEFVSGTIGTIDYAYVETELRPWLSNPTAPPGNFSTYDDNIVKKYSASIIHADSQQVFVDVGGYEGLNVVVSGLNRIAPGMQVQL